MPQVTPICLQCEHYITGKKCEAFEEIPDAIWFGDNDHKQNVRGDDGIKFQQIPEEFRDQ